MATQPNIIVFHADSWDGRKLAALGGDSSIRTPHADRLAARSAHVAQAYCNVPLCCPSRAVLWSGRYGHRIGAWNNYQGLPIDDERFRGSFTELVDTVPTYPTLMTRFREAGYRTNLVGTLDFTSGGHSIGARLSAWLRSSGLDLPVLSGPRDDVRGEGERANPQDWQFVDAGCQWITQQAAADEPFFLSLGVRCPHPYRTTSETWLERIDPDTIALPEIEESPHPIVAAVQRARHCDRPIPDEQRRFLRRRYAAMIAEADAMLGAVMDAVEQAGLWENTYFVFLSDHGEMNLEHNLVFKSMFHEPSSRVMMMLAGPGVQPGLRLSEGCASLVDVAPTLLELAGIEPNVELDGHSLTGALSGRGDLPEEAFGEYHANGVPTGGFMLRSGDWKYHTYPGYPAELFHLPSDPDERDNRAETDPETAAEMDRRLRAHVDIETVDAEAKRNDRECFARWRAEQDEASYREAMSNLYGVWTERHEAAVRAWLNESPSA